MKQQCFMSYSKLQVVSVFSWFSSVYLQKHVRFHPFPHWLVMRE